jgi:hypothetical protein
MTGSLSLTSLRRLTHAAICTTVCALLLSGGLAASSPGSSLAQTHASPVLHGHA